MQIKVNGYEITTSHGTAYHPEVGSYRVNDTHVRCLTCGAVVSTRIEVLGEPPSEEFWRGFATEHGVHKRGCTAG